VSHQLEVKNLECSDESIVEFLEKVGFSKGIDAVHSAITEKQVMDGIEFDAWYTARGHMLQSICKLGQLLTKEIRQNYSVRWSKGYLPDEMWEVFEKYQVAPHNWEDSPDGALVGLTILLAGWVANQSANKTRHNHDDKAFYIFENLIRPMVNIAMDMGAAAK